MEEERERHKKKLLISLLAKYFPNKPKVKHSIISTIIIQPTNQG